MKAATILTVIIVLVAGVVAWFIYSGTYNIAAARPHNDFGRWFFTTVRNQSIEEHAGSIQVPELTIPSLIETGAQHYESSCAMCHGAPGEKPAEFARGLNPAPPELNAGKVQQEFSDAELYWIVENGIRMTGMPAFGPTHKPEELWRIVAFLKQLPHLQAEEYKSMVNGSSGNHHDAKAEQHSAR